MPTRGPTDETDRHSAWSIFKVVVIVALVTFLMGFLLVTAMSRWGGH